MTALLVYSLLTSALYYLLARAEISRFLWSRYPAKLDHFMTCAACSGFWYGVLVSVVLGHFGGFHFPELPDDGYTAHVIVGLCSIVWTPVVSWLHLAALDRLGSTGSAEGG